jgi:hypothetical protein
VSFRWALLDADPVVFVDTLYLNLMHKLGPKFLTGFQVNAEAKCLIIDPALEVQQKYARLLGRARVTGFHTTLTAFNNDRRAVQDAGRQHSSAARHRAS